jgi:hypothetical protein
MVLIVPKYDNVMDVHLKKWCGHGQSRLSKVTFANDPIPLISERLLRLLNARFFAKDYVFVPRLTHMDLWDSEDDDE